MSNDPVCVMCGTGGVDSRHGNEPCHASCKTEWETEYGAYLAAQDADTIAGERIADDANRAIDAITGTTAPPAKEFQSTLFPNVIQRVPQ